MQHYEIKLSISRKSSYFQILLTHHKWSIQNYNGITQQAKLSNRLIVSSRTKVTIYIGLSQGNVL